MGKNDDKSIIGVVIPGYGHPQFLAEAVISACEQKLDRDYKVVVVDDGCKFPETSRMVGQLMEKYQGILHYFRQKNTGLPGARNAGVRFLMALEPEIDSIYFLDADNRIAPYSLQAFRDVLGDDPEIGWAYPDISMFGLSGSEDGFDTRETAPNYSKLKHLVGNISEAGSLVRTDVFRNGVFYNEEMTSGFEDWDFWLGALEAGYIGQRVRHSGFLYRRRPESMLADSRRLEETLIAQIRETHKSLYQPKNILKQEQLEAPAFAVFVAGADDVILSSDPKITSATMPVQHFKEKAHAWAHSPREHFFPEYLIVLSRAEWAQIQAQSGCLRWYLWHLREQALECAAVTLHESDKFDIRRKALNDDFTHQPASFICIKTSLLRAALLNSMSGISVGGTVKIPQPEEFCVSAPQLGKGAAGIEPVGAHMKVLEQFMADLLPLKSISGHQTRHYAGPSCVGIRDQLVSEICAVEGRAPFPVNTGAARAMILVGAEHLFSDVATGLVTALLKRLKAEGCETLVVLEMEPGQSFANADLSWWDLADDVVPMSLSGGNVEYRIYLGRRVPLKLGLLAREDLTVLARSCDVLLSCGAAAGLEALGQAKSHGAKGYVWFDPAFLVNSGQEMNHQAKLLAFEHAVAGVVTDDPGYVYGLSAEGFPPSKFQTPAEFWQGWNL